MPVKETGICGVTTTGYSCADSNSCGSCSRSVGRGKAARVLTALQDETLDYTSCSEEVRQGEVAAREKFQRVKLLCRALVGKIRNERVLDRKFLQRHWASVHVAGDEFDSLMALYRWLRPHGKAAVFPGLDKLSTFTEKTAVNF